MDLTDENALRLNVLAITRERGTKMGCIEWSSCLILSAKDIFIKDW